MTQDLQKMRQPFFDSWQKRYAQNELTPIEKQLLEIILLHPEYHPIFDNTDTLTKDYTTDENPFLHMSLHLGLMEQLSTNRPEGIRDIYQTLYQKNGSEHHVQHLMMDVMGTVIFEAQRTNQLPDERAYLEALRLLAR